MSQAPSFSLRTWTQWQSINQENSFFLKSDLAAYQLKGMRIKEMSQPIKNTKRATSYSSLPN